MAEETEQPLKGKKSAAEPQVTLSVSELSAMIKEAVKAEAARSSDATTKVLEDFTGAMKDLRKPYVDPRSEENDRRMREQMRETNKRILESIAYSRNLCPHFQGSSENSDFQGALSSIVKHVLDTGVVWGICTNCQREFWPEDPDYAKEMNRKSGNRPSQAGRRMFLDPRAAAVAGR